METMILSLAVILLAGLGLSLGVLAGRGPVKGSCGGSACIPGADCAGCRKRDGDPAP